MAVGKGGLGVGRSDSCPTLSKAGGEQKMGSLTLASLDE